MNWKPDWAQARANLERWWDGEGLVMCVKAPRREPLLSSPEPTPPASLRDRWLLPSYRVRRAEYEMATTWYGGDAFPYFDTHIGPGSLGVLLGAEPHFAPTTVWYEPSIDDPSADEPLAFCAEGNAWFNVHMALLETGLSAAQGRYFVGIPDLIEGLDTLAALRGNEALLVDLIERPDWIHRRLDEITEAYFEVFDRMHACVAPASEGGNAFSAFHLWGPGRTAKLQCDFSCMISPAMFGEFVVPYLERQCRRLDHVLYHLDGTQAVQHLDALLAIDGLAAIQWTPQAGLPAGGSPAWYDLYRRIKAGGKGVQAPRVAVDEVIPLLDAVGPDGMFVTVFPQTQEEGEQLLERVSAYRTPRKGPHA